MISVVFLASFLLHAPTVLGLQCWNCTAYCEERGPWNEEKGHTKVNIPPCVTDSGCKYSDDEKVTCGDGINHCLKRDNNDGTVTRSCAYWSLPVETYEKEIRKLGMCFRDGGVKRVAAKFGLKPQKDILQCPCQSDLCNEGDRLGTGALGMLLTVTFFVLFV